MKDLQIVIREGLDKVFWSLRSNSIALLTLSNTFYMCFLQSSFESTNIPKYFEFQTGYAGTIER